MPDMPWSVAGGPYTDTEGHPLSEDYETFIATLIRAGENMVELTQNYVSPQSEESWFNYLLEMGEAEALDHIYNYVDDDDLSKKDVIKLFKTIQENIPITQDNWRPILRNAYTILTFTEGANESTHLLFGRSTTLMLWTVTPGEFSVSVWACWKVEDMQKFFPCSKVHMDSTLNRRMP